EDADHHMRIAAQRNGLTDNLRIGRKTPAPKAVAENDDFIAVGQILLRREGAAADRHRAEKAEIIGAYLRGLELLRKATAGQVDHAGAKRGYVLDDAGLIPPMLEFCGRSARSGALRRGVHE